MSKHSSGPEKGRLMALGKRIAQIAENISEASLTGPAPPSEQEVVDAIRARILRLRYFPESLFAEPAWDMLLELLLAEMEGRQVSVTNLCEAAGTPGTITRRWLSALVAEGLVLRFRNSEDATSEIICLQPRASAAFRRYFDELSKVR